MIGLYDITEEDFSDILEMTRKKNIMKFIGNGKVWNEEKVSKFIGYNLQEQGQHRNQRKEYYYKIVFCKGNEEVFVGIIGAHTMKGRKGFYLTIMIEKEYQGMGYYREGLELLKEVLKRERIKTDRLKSLVRKSNKRMNEISMRRYYFNEEIRFNGEEFNEYFIFLRKLTYLVKTKYFNLSDINTIMKERGIWRPFKKGKDRNPDFIHVDGDFSYDPKLYKYRSLLKNLLVNNDLGITNKDNLYKNLSKIEGGKKYLLENYNITIKEDKEKYSHLFNDKEPWIVKPVGESCGKGIEIITTFEEFNNYFLNLHNKHDVYSEKFVLQKYITNPLLFEGRKFHMRYHMICYNEEFLPLENAQVITARKKFNLKDLKDKGVHDSHNEGSLKGVYFPYSFDLKKKEIEKVNKQIVDMLTKCVSLVNFDCWKESKKCYHVFGADIMVLDDLSVKILEINRKIGMKTGQETKYVNSDESYNTHLFSQEMEFVVDRIFPPSRKTDDESLFIKL